MKHLFLLLCLFSVQQVFAQEKPEYQKFKIGCGYNREFPNAGGEDGNHFVNNGIKISYPLHLTKKKKHNLISFVEVGPGRLKEFYNIMNNPVIDTYPSFGTDISLNYLITGKRHFFFIGPRSGVLWTGGQHFLGPFGLNMGYGVVVRGMRINIYTYTQMFFGSFIEGYSGFGIQLRKK